MRVFVVLFFSFFVQSAYPFASVVSDPVTQGLIMAGQVADSIRAWEERVYQKIEKVQRYTRVANQVREDLDRYKQLAKLLTSQVKDQVEVLQLIAQLKVYGIVSEILDSDIILLKFNLEEYMKIFKIIEDMIQSLVESLNSEVMAARTELNKRIQEVLESYQKTKKAFASLKTKLKLLEQRYKFYEQSFNEFKGFYQDMTQLKF